MSEGEIEKVWGDANPPGVSVRNSPQSQRSHLNQEELVEVEHLQWEVESALERLYELDSSETRAWIRNTIETIEDERRKVREGSL